MPGRPASVGEIPQGLPWVGSEPPERLRSLGYPRHYLDFETIQFAVPVWARTRPYQQLPFQWSCHREDGRGHLSHHEFLDASGSPPMRRFAESVLEALGRDGPSSFTATSNVPSSPSLRSCSPICRTGCSGSCPA